MAILAERRIGLSCRLWCAVKIFDWDDPLPMQIAPTMPSEPALPFHIVPTPDNFRPRKVQTQRIHPARAVVCAPCGPSLYRLLADALLTARSGPDFSDVQGPHFSSFAFNGMPRWRAPRALLVAAGHSVAQPAGLAFVGI